MAPPLLRQWLEEPGSLTRRMRRSCRECFHVEVLGERWGAPFLDEARRLRMRHKNWAWLREVLLCCGGRPWVYGRSVIPPQALRGRLHRLQQLGRRPLGRVLFDRYPVGRGKIEMARLKTDDPLYQRVSCNTTVVPGCWARRSVFRVAGRHLLVTEVFLPDLAVRAAAGRLP